MALDDRCPHRWAPLSEGRVEGDEIKCPYHGMQLGPEFLVRGSHIVTPGLRGRTNYFWAAAFDIPDVPTEASETSRRNVTAAFDEDKHLLEHMQAQLKQDPRQADAPEVGLAADGAGLRVRQVLQRRLEAEGRTLT